MKVVKVSLIIKKLIEKGYYLDRQKGSHRQFKHPGKSGVVTVNGKPSDDTWGFELKSIEKQSGIEF